jgi:amino acid permease
MKHASIGVGLILMGMCGLVSCFAAYCCTLACEVTKRESYSETLAFTLFGPESYEEFLRRRGLPSSDEICNASKQDFRENETRKIRYRKAITLALEAIIFLNNFGTLIVYSKVISTCIPPVIRSFLGGSGLWVSSTTWLLIGGAMFFLLSCVRTMNELILSSVVGVATIMYVVICVIYRYVHPTALPDGESPQLQHDIQWLSLTTEVFQTLSSYGVAFGYHFNIPYFYRELRHRTPKELMKTVGIAFPIVTTTYATCGVLGYLTFGALVASKRAGGDIVQNYRDDDTLVNIGRLGLFFHFASVFPILSVCARRGMHRIIMNILVAVSSNTVDENNTPTLPETLDDSDGDPLTSLCSATEEPRDVGNAEDTTRLAIVIEALIIVACSVFLAGVVDGIAPVIDVIGTLFGLFLIFIAPSLMGLRVFGRAAYSVQHRFFDATGSFQNQLWYRVAQATLIVGLLITGVGFIFVCLSLGS